MRNLKRTDKRECQTYMQNPDLSLPLPCGPVRSKITCALRRMRSLALWSTTPLSQNLNAQPESEAAKPRNTEIVHGEVCGGGLRQSP